MTGFVAMYPQAGWTQPIGSTPARFPWSNFPQSGLRAKYRAVFPKQTKFRSCYRRLDIFAPTFGSSNNARQEA